MRLNLGDYVDTLIMWLSAVILAGLFVAGFVIATNGAPTEVDVLPPCPTEDSVSCYWDAQHRGNGLGRSFTVDADGVVTYLDGK